ncbi:MAG: YggS family pyridoxal phosphate-dependent enzyme [Panacagrimonas sp.]
MSALAESLALVRKRIEHACVAAGRPLGSVSLLAVSKSFGAEAVRAVAAAGQTAFAESYLQEALRKREQLSDLPLAWHFIGPVQSNKTRDIALHFDWVHGVDRLKIAARLSSARTAMGEPLNVCVQVNISNEPSKSGCSVAETLPLCRAIGALPHLRLRGLMAIPAPIQPGADPRKPFRGLRLLYESIRAAGIPLDTISAGMTDDLEAAIAEGSTLVRVGTAIFGTRNTP